MRVFFADPLFADRVGGLLQHSLEVTLARKSTNLKALKILIAIGRVSSYCFCASASLHPRSMSKRLRVQRLMVDAYNLLESR